MLEEIDAVNSMGSSGRVRGQSERPNSDMSSDDLCQYNSSIENIPAVCLLVVHQDTVPADVVYNIM